MPEQSHSKNLYLRLSTFYFPAADATPEELSQGFQQDYIRQGMLDKLLRGQCSFDDYLDVLEENDCDMDDYLNILDLNLSDFV